MKAFKILYKIRDYLTLKASFTKIAVSAASVGQDQAAQNVQTDLRSTLSAMLEHYQGFFTKKVTPIIGVFPSVNFRQAISFSPRNQFFLR